MTKDAFGHEIKFGTRLIVSKMRRDGKYPVRFVFASSGRAINKLMTKDALDAWIQHVRVGGNDPEVVGYTKPPKTQAQLDADIAEALAERGSAHSGGGRSHSTMLQQQDTGADRFWDMYEEELVDSVAKNPGDYGGLEINEPPEVYARRIRQSFQKHAETDGLGSINLDSNTFKRLARRIGIKKFSQRALKEAYAGLGGKK